ncbi:LamG-like jellyroll fold domain-containing protein [Pendulispora albinea]|uniref:Uncharacterized protein n=1 Tax=Pendulispora albinea TaxID=2741071 RepID=A0ABZ2LYP1_9BACT
MAFVACGLDDGGSDAPPPRADGSAPGVVTDSGAAAPKDGAGHSPVDAEVPACRPEPLPGHRFTLAVIPDTQYLFDKDRGDPRVLEASVRWIVEHAREHNIVFTAGLGDMTENHQPEEFEAIDRVYDIFDQNGVQYSLPAGNHDVTSSKLDDQRNPDEPYLKYFSPKRVMGNRTFGGATSNGFNTFYIFEGGGQKWLLLALDWRMSPSSMQWARDVIAQHPTLPVIVTTHELVDHRGVATDPPSDNAVLRDYGQKIWNELIQNNDQIFLTLNGHFWTPARTTKKNASGHDVHLHLTNYQDRYYGGSGMIRLYEFDLDRNTIDVSTHSPYMAAIPAAQRLPAQQAEVEMTGPNDRFVESIDFKSRFAAFSGIKPPAPPPSLPAEQVTIPGTLAYWRFDNESGDTGTGAVTGTIRDRSGRGNDLVRVTAAGGKDEDLAWAKDYHPSQPGHGSLLFKGSKTTPPSYLQTVDTAPLNGSKLETGYTIEAFVHLPDDCCDGHAWMGLLGRLGTGGDAGKTGSADHDDLLEPVATLSVTDGRGFQWAIYPLNYDGIKTNWSHIVYAQTWQHIALVNDGHRTIMYIDGAPVVRNPQNESIGISTVGRAWLVGATSYDNKIEQAFDGSLGDVRIVDHALPVDRFMTARP